MNAPAPAPPGEPRIAARRVRFDWTGTPAHWLPGDVQGTHTMNVLHMLLPTGERWFVNVYRQALPLVTDDRLRREVRGFMGQEATHARAHDAVLAHLAAQGIDASPYTDWLEREFERGLGDRPWGLPLPDRLARALGPAWLRSRLAIIAAIEHFTAVLGGWVLEAEGLDAAGVDPVMLDLLRWHGAEEVEHRSVAFDMYEHVSGAYVRRALAMAVTAPVMAVVWIAGVRFLMDADPGVPDGERPTWRSFRRTTRAGRLPPLTSLARSVPSYLRRGFHPSQEGSTARAVAYLTSSPAVLGAEAGSTGSSGTS